MAGPSLQIRAPSLSQGNPQANDPVGGGGAGSDAYSLSVLQKQRRHFTDGKVRQRGANECPSSRPWSGLPGSKVHILSVHQDL